MVEETRTIEDTHPVSVDGWLICSERISGWIELLKVREQLLHFRLLFDSSGKPPLRLGSQGEDFFFQRLPLPVLDARK